MFDLLIYTISLYIISISGLELSLTESNKQISEFYKTVIIEKQRHRTTLQSKFFILANYAMYVIQRAVVST